MFKISMKINSKMLHGQKTEMEMLTLKLTKLTKKTCNTHHSIGVTGSRTCLSFGVTGSRTHLSFGVKAPFGAGDAK